MKKKSNFKRLMELAGNHKYLAYISSILAGFSSIIALIPFYNIWCIIKEVLEVRPNFSEARNIGINGWLAVIFSIASMILYLLSLLCSHKLAFRVQRNMRELMIKHISIVPLGYIESEGSGKIRKIINDSSQATETYLAHNLADKVVSFVTPIGLIISMMFFDYRIGLVCLIPALLGIIILFSLMMGPKMQNDIKEYQNALDNMSKEGVEYIRGIPVVKTFGQTIFTFKRFKNSIDDYEKWTISYTKKMMKPMVIFMTSINSIFAFIIVIGYLLSGNGISNELILNIIFYILISQILTVSLTKIAYSSESNMIVSDSLERMDNLLNVEPLDMNGKNKFPNNYDIHIDNIYFKYKENKNNAIDGITLNIKMGEHIALVGKSGSGKTTLASLISRFWDTSNGTIKIGDINIKDIDYKELMNNVSYVFQDSKLLKMSILDNVRMGNPNASIEEVMNALEKAQCMDIINKLPLGINTIIGSKGVYVSGGEIQRLSIARAFLKNPKILVLDEATAFSDPDNEKLIEKAFYNLSKDKTVIMIAHRLSTIKDCDRIYLLNDGRIAEEGNHEELLNSHGIYTHMWNEYLNSINWKLGDLND